MVILPRKLGAIQIRHPGTIYMCENCNFVANVNILTLFARPVFLGRMTANSILSVYCQLFCFIIYVFKSMAMCSGTLFFNLDMVPHTYKLTLKIMN